MANIQKDNTDITVVETPSLTDFTTVFVSNPSFLSNKSIVEVKLGGSTTTTAEADREAWE